MHTLTICFGPTNAIWMLVFKNKDKAETAWKSVTDSNLIATLEDDFGQTICVKKEAISGLMLEDTDLSKNAHIEVALQRARVQAEGQTRANADPVLRTAQMRQGPSVIAPGMNGFGGRN